MDDRPRSAETEGLRDSASRVLRSGALGSGRVLPELFQYLVEKAFDGEVPKEFDIAVDVFGKDARYRDAGDAQIRVWIHRLRSRLERYYANAGSEDPFRIEIPKGTYRIAIGQRSSGDRSPRYSRRRGLTLAGGALALVSALALAVWKFLPSSSITFQRLLPSSSIWSGIGQSDLPILIVVGDHFFFGEPDAPIRVRDIRINSEQELRDSTEFRENPDLIFETLSYLPKSVAFGLQHILPLANAYGTSVTMKLVSELTSEDLRDYDIVFLGFIRSMGVLRDYYLTKSTFSLQPPYLEIVHPGTEHAFVRSGPLPNRNKDYGLFARFSGPSGNQILVFSGIGDPGVLATARALNTPSGSRQIDALIESNAVDVSGGWEVLLEVDGHSRTDLDFRVLGLFAMDEPREHHDERQSLKPVP